MKLETLFAEAIRKREGIEVNEEAIRHLLVATREGHLCATGAALQGPFEEIDGKVLFEKYAYLEEGIARNVCRLLQRKNTAKLDCTVHEQLTAEQKRAVAAGLENNFVLLTGGPGTGKTFTIAQMIRAFPEDTHIVVAAPTGKAASHLQSGIERALTGRKGIVAGTIHTVLGIRDSYEAINKDLYLGADLIIIDECSMIDVTMWYALFRAISEDSKVILVGDTDQLPPVETGSIFSHLCGFLRRRFPEQTIHLTKCLRSESEEIVTLAKAINSGNSQEAIRVLESGSHIGFTDFLNFPPFHLEEGPKEWLSHATRYRILSALKEGELGVKALNARFAHQYRHGERWIEPIMITKTNRDLGLFNGENGVALRHRDEKEKDKAYFLGRDGNVLSIPLSLLPRYELAYALSIHKSQGSEYDHVTLVLQAGAASFGRELIYTGITRAKKSISIYGTKEILLECMTRHTLRESTLGERLGRDYGAFENDRRGKT